MKEIIIQDYQQSYKTYGVSIDYERDDNHKIIKDHTAWLRGTQSRCKTDNE